MKLKIRDKVIIITGKDRGKVGIITKVLNKKDAVVIEGLNIKTKHIKKTANRPGEKITFEAPIKSSKVMIVDPQTGKPSRISYRMLNNGKKERISKVSGTSLDLPPLTNNSVKNPQKNTTSLKTTKKQKKSEE